uniref:FAD-binding PCMH-type domain-containing protein n=1 Tax=Auxenochlorella protothecoides TaxID=3075 RepID=A0A1D1ZQN5_AUXPR
MASTSHAPRSLQRLLRRVLGTCKGGGEIRSFSSRASRPAPHDAPHPFRPPTPEELRAMKRNNILAGVLLVGAAGASYYSGFARRDPILSATPKAEFSNWSGTHTVVAHRLYEPESLKDLENIMNLAHKGGSRLRVVGSALSPNGMAFSEEGMLSLAHMDAILSIDAERRLVTVQAGARIADVAARLREHGLTLQNYASIREQSVAGFVQAGAHGTGAGIPPVDAQVVGMKLVTPAEGVLDITEESDPELFRLARVGLGCLGVVAELTLRCVPAHRLLETTSVESAAQVRAAHATRLAAARHLRYMWIPHTDAVVVVQSVEAGPEAAARAEAEIAAAAAAAGRGKADPAAALRALAVTARLLSEREAAPLSAFQLRDELLAHAPLDAGWVRRVNAAEAAYWRGSAGHRVGWSDEVLGFDCGGQQCVSEACFATGTRAASAGADLAYARDLLALVEREGLPAPAPIEQRWTAGSASAMSPARGGAADLFSWVGIIQYLPVPEDGDAEGERRRDAVVQSFKRYRTLVSEALFDKYDAVEHWAKVEPPEDAAELEALRQRLGRRFPVAAFQAARRRLDPKNILSNDWVNALFPLPQTEEAGDSDEGQPAARAEAA